MRLTVDPGRFAFHPLDLVVAAEHGIGEISLGTSARGRILAQLRQGLDEFRGVQ